MKYQLGYYDSGSEAWRFARGEHDGIRHFDSLNEARLEAEALSKQSSHLGHSIVVLTLHCCVKTDVTYPKPEPIYTTHEVDILEPKR